MDTAQSDEDNIDSLLFDEWNDAETSNGLGNIRISNQNVSGNVSFNNSVINATSNRLDVSALCCDEELSGFDKDAGPTWIYPTNYDVRDYQFNIVSRALFKNTLVSLPTGLGKTFIAAVVMYNYYRWYPRGKILFTAPTRPLVAQQIDACYNITAIPHQDTVEMTGSMQTNARKIAWKQKRVFFATPQVIHNDLESGICPGELIRCLVIDEAHRAKGKHAYCQLVEGLTLKGCNLFRMLALSATPGSKVEDVIAVVKNLHIAHLELRSEQCLDVAMYSHSRKIETIVIPLGEELTNIRKQYVEILDIYTRRLVQYKILNGNIGGLSKGKIIMLFKEYQTKEKTQRHPQHQRIMQDFTMVITLYHAMELLTKHGSRVFLNFFDERTDKQWVGKDDNLTCFLERLRDDLGVNPFTINRSTLPDGTIPEIKEDLKFGHPKFDHLKEIMLKHFQEAEKKGIKTKSIVFCEYRESVHLAHCLLLQCRPMIRPHVFIGQSAGSAGSSSKESHMKAFSQKQQLKVMNMFREGVCNVLVSTCIGEEGLDIGSVDLIVCFDISNKSPVRLVQRCGRTGRERKGHVVILVTEGREHQTLRECILQRDSLNRRVLQSKELIKNLYTASPRMIPRSLDPKCQKMYITVQKHKQEEKVTKQSGKVQSKIKDMLKRNNTASSTDSWSDFQSLSKNNHATDEDLSTLFPNGLPTCSRFQDNVEYWNKSKDFLKIENGEETSVDKLKLCEWLEWQRTLQFTVNVEHSVDSEILSNLLKTADSKRFESFENPNFSINPEYNSPPRPITPLKVLDKAKPKIKTVKNDIRALFQKMYKPTEEEIKIAAFEDKAKEIFEDCGLAVSNEGDRKKMLQDDGITSAMINLMVEINLQLPNLEAKRKFKCDPHVCFQVNLKNDAIRSSKHFNVLDDNIMKIVNDMENIDIAQFEKMLKLQEISSSQQLNNKISDFKSNFVSTDIDFCDDSLLKLNDRHVFDDTLSENDVNTGKYVKKQETNTKILKNHIIETEEPLDENICKLIINDDFDIGDVDEIFEETDYEQSESRKNDTSKIDENCQTRELNLAYKNNINLINAVRFNQNDNSTEALQNDDSTQTIQNDDSKQAIQNVDSNITVDYEANKKLVFENDFNFGDIDDVFENTDEELENEIPDNIPALEKCTINNKSDEKSKPTGDPLTFFGLEDIEDIFANDDIDLCDNANTLNSVKVDTPEKDDSNDPPNSPILFSQKPSSKVQKLSLKNHLTSTPLVTSQIIKETNQNPKPPQINSLVDVKDVSILSHKFLGNTAKNCSKNRLTPLKEISLNETLHKTNTSFSITQIIDMINNEDEQNISTAKNKHNTIKPCKIKDTECASDESDHSVILCSQIVKPVIKKTNTISQKVSLTILETSESSSDDGNISEAKDYERIENNECLDTSNCLVKYSSKRKLSSEDEFESSPFFEEFSAVTPRNNLKKSKMSLREKLMSIKQNEKSPVSHSSQNENITLNRAPVDFQNKLLQFSKPMATQWTSDCSQNKKTIKSTSEPIKVSSDDDFDVRTSSKKRKRKKKQCQFIDYEARLSDDSYEDSGDDEHSQESLEASVLQFICDEDDIEEHHSNNDIDMHAKYLQSVRSPVKSHGQFKIPVLKPKRCDISIFSEADPDEHANYELDSFCVGDHILSQRHDMSELELAEAILKKRKRRRKKELRKSPIKLPCTTNPADDSPIAVNKKKTGRFVINSESSTDDELFL